MEKVKKSPKEIAYTVELIITRINTKFKQNRNSYGKSNKEIKEEILEKKSKVKNKDLSFEAKEVIRLQQKEKDKKEMEEMREHIREFKKNREVYLKRLCNQYGISAAHILRITGYNSNCEQYLFED